MEPGLGTVARDDEVGVTSTVAPNSKEVARGESNISSFFIYITDLIYILFLRIVLLSRIIYVIVFCLLPKKFRSFCFSENFVLKKELTERAEF